MSPNRTPNISGGPLGRVWFRNKVEWNVLVPVHWNGLVPFLYLVGGNPVEWNGYITVFHWRDEIECISFNSSLV